MIDFGRKWFVEAITVFCIIPIKISGFRKTYFNKGGKIVAKTKTTCKVESCAYHHPDDLCAAGEIQVENYSRSAVCDTFYPRDVNSQFVSGKDVQAGTDMRDSVMADDSLGLNMADASHIYESHASNLTPLVTCNADDCRYWEHEVCKAKSITIDGQMAAISGETRCKTFDPR